MRTRSPFVGSALKVSWRHASTIRHVFGQAWARDWRARTKFSVNVFLFYAQLGSDVSSARKCLNSFRLEKILEHNAHVISAHIQRYCALLVTGGFPENDMVFSVVEQGKHTSLPSSVVSCACWCLRSD